MRKIRLFAIVVAVLLRSAPLHGAEPLARQSRRAAEGGMDRAALLAALDQRATTGVPRHLDHDDGEELQAAVSAGLAKDSDDKELAWAAIRASVAIGTESGPIVNAGATPSAAIELLPRLALPWRMKVTGRVDVSLDGSAWRTFAEFSDVHAGTGVNLDRLFHKDAIRPGFHVLRFRASLRYTGQPDGVPATEVRMLPPAAYAVPGTSKAGLQAASFLASGMRANAFELDHALPGMPLDQWLRSVPYGAASTDDGPPPVVWSTVWCEARTGSDAARRSVCARATMGASPVGGHAEIWVKVADVDMATSRPSWTPVTPELEGVDLHNGSAWSIISLSELPFARRTGPEGWPHAAVVADASAISVTPATARPGEPVAVRATLRNTGAADLNGITIDVLVFDTPERTLLHRRFVRTIRAGASVVLETGTSFPLGYAGIVVSVMPVSDHTVFNPLMTGESNGVSHAARLVHPERAPRPFVQAVRASMCRSAACPNVR